MFALSFIMFIVSILSFGSNCESFNHRRVENSFVWLVFGFSLVVFAGICVFHFR